MKTMLISVLCCMLSTISMSAQTSQVSSEQLKFRNGIEQFLKVEGYIPTYDDSDNSINFKKEGTRYWIAISGEGPYYLEFHRPGLNVDDADRAIVLEACNDANYNKRCGKACLGKNSVVITAEYYVNSVEEFKSTFYTYLRVVDYTRSAVKEYYNEHDK